MRKLCLVISGVHLVPPFVRGTSEVQEEKPLTSRTLRYALKRSGKWEPRLVVSLKSVPILIVEFCQRNRVRGISLRRGTVSIMLDSMCVCMCVAFASSALHHKR